MKKNTLLSFFLSLILALGIIFSPLATAAPANSTSKVQKVAKKAQKTKKVKQKKTIKKKVRKATKKKAKKKIAKKKSSKKAGKKKVAKKKSSKKSNGKKLAKSSKKSKPKKVAQKKPLQADVFTPVQHDGEADVVMQSDDLLMYAMGLLGIDYRYGGSNPKSGLDCSGFIQYVFREAAGINLPRTSAAMSETGTAIDKQDLKPGDLVFFNSRKSKRVSHVGMYVGDDKFIHAPQTGKDIEIQDLSKQYYVKHYVGARRIAHPHDSARFLQ